MSTEYIERGAAIKTLIAAIHNDGFQAESNIERHELREDEIEDALLSVPAADVAEVVHARWEPNGLYEGNRWYVCSNCTNEVAFTFPHRYCNGCGARMDGDAHV